jgi:Domain of unknown function (DUF4365)
MLSQNAIKQEISFLYLHALVTRLGYSLERTSFDFDSIDATICGKDIITGSKDTLSSPKIDVQLKATEQECSMDSIPFRISQKNYNDLSKISMVPRILIVIFLPLGKDWLECDLEKLIIFAKGYWMSLKGMEKTDNLSNKTIYLSQSQRLSQETVQRWMIAAANREDIAYASC